MHSEWKKDVASIWQSCMEELIMRQGYILAVILAVFQITHGKMALGGLVTLIAYYWQLLG
jgi:ABC-type bacteriocin/lantibiotic exporter with double-glycine peptidase domain